MKRGGLLSSPDQHIEKREVDSGKVGITSLHDGVGGRKKQSAKGRLFQREKITT